MTENDRNHKARAEPEEHHHGNNDTMISLETLMAALRLVSDQRIGTYLNGHCQLHMLIVVLTAERSLRDEQGER